MIRNFLLGGVVLVALGMGTASADTFTESVRFGLGPTDFNNATGTTSGPGGNTLYYFDTSGGATLNSITFTYSYAISSQITVTNTSQGTSTGSTRTQSGAQFSSTSSAITAALNNIVNNYVDPIDGTAVTFGTSTLTPIAADVRGNNNTYSLASGGSQSFTSQGNQSRSGIVDTNSADLSAFSRSGGGTFTPTFTTLTGLINTISGGNTTANQVTSALGSLTITYNYTLPTTTPTAVPEPASMALLGAGLVSLGVFRRRRG